jgi:hypothetical protein
MYGYHRIPFAQPDGALACIADLVSQLHTGCQFCFQSDVTSDAVGPPTIKIAGHGYLGVPFSAIQLPGFKAAVADTSSTVWCLPADDIVKIISAGACSATVQCLQDHPPLLVPSTTQHAKPSCQPCKPRPHCLCCRLAQADGHQGPDDAEPGGQGTRAGAEPHSAAQAAAGAAARGRAPRAAAPQQHPRHTPPSSSQSGRPAAIRCHR